MTEIQDFGQKIGGAKKDLWRERNLMLSDLVDLNDAEKDKYIVKDRVWKKPDYQALVDSGIPVRVVYFMKLMRDATPTRPVLSYIDKRDNTIKEKQEGYVSFVTDLRNKVMSLKEESEVLGFYENFLFKNYLLSRRNSYSLELRPEAFGCVNNKMLKAARQYDFRKIDREIKEKQFCYTEEQKIQQLEENYFKRHTILTYDNDKVKFEEGSDGYCRLNWHKGYSLGNFKIKDESFNPDTFEIGKVMILLGNQIIEKNIDNEEVAEKMIRDVFKQNLEKQKNKEVTTTQLDSKKKRKGRLVPKQLEHLERQGEDYRKGIHARGADYLKVFGFKGGEFGNYMNEQDRIGSLDYCYDALLDMCKAIDIHPSNISLDNKLSIAFGARGSGNALAHYEPLLEVINITKLRGAGSLAHEFFHALDDIIGKKVGQNGFLTQNRKGLNSFDHLMDTIKYKEKTLTTEEQMKENQDRYNKSIEKFKKDVLMMVSDKILTEEKINERDTLMNELIEKAKTPNIKFIDTQIKSRNRTSKTINPAINPLVAFIDENSKYYKMTSNNKEVICWELDIVAANYQALSLVPEPKQIQVETDFYKHAKEIDNNFSKSGHGYWASNVELAARAFACYVKDKLAKNGMRNDYLCGHADRIGIETNTGRIHQQPMGEEREIINDSFDLLIEDLKDKDILKAFDDKDKSFYLFNSKSSKSLIEQMSTAEDIKLTTVKMRNHNDIQQYAFDFEMD